MSLNLKDQFMGVFMTIVKVVGISIFVLIGFSLSYQYITTKLDERKYPPVGKLIDVKEVK